MYLAVVVKESPKSPLFRMSSTLLGPTARPKITHTIHVLKNNLGFSLWKLLNSPWPMLDPLCKICERFHGQVHEDVAKDWSTYLACGRLLGIVLSTSVGHS